MEVLLQASRGSGQAAGSPTPIWQQKALSLHEEAALHCGFWAGKDGKTFSGPWPVSQSVGVLPEIHHLQVAWWECFCDGLWHGSVLPDLCFQKDAAALDGELNAAVPDAPGFLGHLAPPSHAKGSALETPSLGNAETEEAAGCSRAEAITSDSSAGSKSDDLGKSCVAGAAPGERPGAEKETASAPCQVSWGWRALWSVARMLRLSFVGMYVLSPCVSAAGSLCHGLTQGAAQPLLCSGMKAHTAPLRCVPPLSMPYLLQGACGEQWGDEVQAHTALGGRSR